MSWPAIPLRRLFRVVNGGTPSSDESNWGGDVPWATPVDVGAASGAWLSVTQRTLTVTGAITGSRIVPEDSILLSTRAPVGYVAQVKVPMAFNQGCRALVATRPVNVRYFVYQLASMANELQARGQGTTFLELSSEALAAAEVTVPPVAEQRRIAAFLDVETARIDRLMHLRKSMLVRLEERDKSVRDGLVNGLFDRQGEISLRRFSAIIEQGDSPQCEAFSRDDAEEWAVLKLSAVKQGRFDPGENKRLPVGIRPNPAHEVRPGDLLVTRANTPSLVGDVAVASAGCERLLLPDLVYRVKLASGILPSFVAQVALSGRVRAGIEASARGSSQSMVKLRGEDIKAWPMPRATNVQQRELIRVMNQTTAASSRLRASIVRQLALLAERRQGLITAAVTGQLDVTSARPTHDRDL